MSQEDVVQINDVGFFKGTIAGAVLATTLRRGIGTVTRTGVGILNITFPNGRGIDNTVFALMTFYTTDGSFAEANINFGGSTDTVKVIETRNDLAVLIDVPAFAMSWGNLQ